MPIRLRIPSGRKLRIPAGWMKISGWRMAIGRKLRMPSGREAWIPVGWDRTIRLPMQTGWNAQDISLDHG